MKLAKLVLSIVVIVFSILGLLKVLSFEIANPIMLFAMATLLVLRSIEYKKNRDNSGFILSLLTALFVYFVVIYGVIG